MTAIKFITAIVFLIFIAAFSVVNMESVPVSFYNYKFAVEKLEVPLIFVVLVPFVIGFLLAWFFALVARIKLKTTLMRKNRTIENLSKELEQLKSPSRISDPVGTLNAD